MRPLLSGGTFSGQVVMPFTFQPFDVTREGTELVLRGRLLSGAYFGPESVIVQSKSGEQLSTHIHSHGMEYPEAWPVLAEHRKTILVLRIPSTPPDFQIALLTGVGAVAPASKRVDISHVLDDPNFWALQAGSHFTSEEVDEPGLEWFGIPSEATGEWYESAIEKHLRAGVWPYVRVPLPGDRYIELEMAAGVEYQDRVWIGEQSGTHRVLLGYHSGHFSLPALRPEEISWLAGVTHMAASNLLWLPTAYLQEGSAAWLALTETLVSRAPGLLRGKASAMSAALLSNVTVDGLTWTRDPGLGWINNWPYSQRNPRSQLSIMQPADFAFVSQMFS